MARDAICTYRLETLSWWPCGQSLPSAGKLSQLSEPPQLLTHFWSLCPRVPQVLSARSVPGMDIWPCTLTASFWAQTQLGILSLSPEDRPALDTSQTAGLPCLSNQASVHSQSWPPSLWLSCLYKQCPLLLKMCVSVSVWSSHPKPEHCTVPSVAVSLGDPHKA